MSSLSRIVLFACLLLAAPVAHAVAGDLLGARPPYVVLQPHPAVGPVERAPAAPYAYGWFGARPRHHPQWGRHFGYYRNYTQWTGR